MISFPLCDTSGIVHSDLLKQQACLFPDLNLENVFSILNFLVSGLFVDLIHLIQSQRARGVISIHVAFASISLSNAFFKSSGISGSGHSLVASISIFNSFPAYFLSTLNQWRFLPSGSSTVSSGEPFKLPFTN